MKSTNPLEQQDKQAAAASEKRPYSAPSIVTKEATVGAMAKISDKLVTMQTLVVKANLHAYFAYLD